MKLTRRKILELAGAGSVSAFALAAWLSGPDKLNPVSPAHAQDITSLMQPGPMGDKAMGKEDAPVTVIEYFSLTCPHCQNFHEKTFPVIKEKYIDTGKVRFIFREFPFDPRATAAFMLTRCAPEEQYFPMVDVLFQQMNVWARSSDPVAELGKIGRLAGFTQEQVTACLKNQEILDSVNAVRDKADKEFKVDATPTFFINGKKYSGYKSPEEMSKIIDDLL